MTNGTCSAEKCPLDCILLKESACAPQKTAHTSLLTNITPPVRALKQTLRCTAVPKTKCGNKKVCATMATKGVERTLGQGWIRQVCEGHTTCSPPA